MRELTPEPEDHVIDPDRLGKIRTSLAESDLDGVAAITPPNSFYLTGCFVGMYSRPVLGVVTGETSGFGGPAIETRTARRSAGTDRAILYEDTEDPFSVLSELIPEAVERLGIDKAQARPDWIDGLDAAIDAELIDATELLQNLRIVKTDWEIKMMRRSSKLASAGMRAFRNTISAGKTELEITAAIQNAFYETYLEQFPEYDIGTANELGQYGFANALTGAHALEPHSLSSSEVVHHGDSIVGIALPSLQGYVCEEERTIFVGDVSPDIRDAMATLVDVREESMDLIEAGRDRAEIDERTSDALIDAGYEEQIVHRTGHGQGVTIHEGPALNRCDSGTLEAGMVISIEPGLYFKDRGIALRHSDTLVVTENGYDRLTSSEDGVLYCN